MEPDTITSGAELKTLTSWCGGCDAEAVFDQVRSGIGLEYACRGCGAAVIAGDLLLIEATLQPGLA